jgi:catechol 2,3-dioxygenase-like lactoylglutathione lyase family enzyme
VIEAGNVTLMVSDFERAVAFYVDVLGLQLGARYGNEWAECRARDGFTIGLHPARDGHVAAGTARIGFTVPDLDEAIGKLEQFGVEFAGPVVEEAALRRADFADPDGNPLYLVQLRHPG